MAHTIAVDLETLESGAGYVKILTFPKRVKVTEISFSVSSEARGTVEQAREWSLYAVGAHPTPTEGNPHGEWTTYVFQGGEKPILDNATAGFVSTIRSPHTELVSLPTGGSVLKLEMHQGVFAPGDYMALWIENTGGDVETIDWSLTNAVISVTYEETAMKTIYEQVQANPWLD